MKVLFLTPHLSTGGMPQFLLQRIKTLQAYSDVEVFVYEWVQTATWFVVQRNQIINTLSKDNFVSCGYFADWSQKCRDKQTDLINFLYKNKIDIVHLEEAPEIFPVYHDNGIFDHDLITDLYDKKHPWKIVESIHRIDFDFLNKKYIPDAFSCVVNSHYDEVKNLKYKAKLIEYPFCGPVSYSTKEEIKLEEGWRKTGEFHILNVGLWTPGKNQKYAIEIAKLLWEKYRWTYIFHFVGNQAPNFEDYWSPLMNDLPPNIRIYGEKNQDEVSKFYKKSDLMLFTSTWECNPIVLKEAISNNLKVMAFNHDHYQGSYNEYIDDLTGNTEKDKDNLIDILHLPLKYEKKLDYSILKSKKEFVNKHLELYESISNRR